MRVVVVGEVVEDVLEVAAVEDEEPVEAFAADGADEAFGKRVRFRGSYRRLHDPDAFAREDGVEIAGELAVTIADQEPEA